MALRVLFSSFLIMIGLGYLTAIFYLVLVDVDPHRARGMGVVTGIEMKYRGGDGISRLETALQGSMADSIETDDRQQMLRWIGRGAPEAGYADVKPIFENSCVACHNLQSGRSTVPLTTYEEVREVTRIDTGLSIVQLARVSHVHLFGISIVFLLTGGIFSLSGTPSWLRISLVGIPYLAILADIGSWWITRYEPLFAYVVVIGGAIMGLALAGQILISLWDMWIDVLRGRSAAGAAPR
jgi:hypothetical protein